MKKVILLLAVIMLSFTQQDTKIVTIKKAWFTSHFNLQTKCPEWTEYTFTEKNLSDVAPRSANFSKDNLISTSAQLSATDYDQKYDRGHLVPDHDMRFSTDAEKDCMVYTNCAPQWYSLNRGPWKGIENYVRDVAAFEIHDTIIVWTGIIFDKNSKTMSSGNRAPSFYWKAIMFRVGGRESNSIGFLCENEDPKSKDIKSYVVSVDSLEKITSIDIFSNGDGYGYESNTKWINSGKEKSITNANNNLSYKNAKQPNRSN